MLLYRNQAALELQSDLSKLTPMLRSVLLAVKVSFIHIFWSYVVWVFISYVWKKDWRVNDMRVGNHDCIIRIKVHFLSKTCIL